MSLYNDVHVTSDFDLKTTTSLVDWVTTISLKVIDNSEFAGSFIVGGRFVKYISVSSVYLFFLENRSKHFCIDGWPVRYNLFVIHK